MVSTKSLISLCFWLLMINFTIENYIHFFNSREAVILIQTLLNCIYVFLALANIKSFKKSNLFVYVYFIIGFLLIMGLFSTAIIPTYNKILKFVTPLMFLPLGYNLIKKKQDLHYFINKLYWLQTFFILGIIYANLFNVGETFYKDGIKVGFLSINSLYTVTFSWITLLFFINDLKLNKVISVVILTATFIIILLILKRTLIILFALSLFLFLFQSIKLKRVVAYSAIFFIGSIIFQTYFSHYFERSVEARSSRFSEDYSVEQEGRFRENVLPFMHMQDNALMYIFGTGEVFNDRPYHFRYLNSDRELHNSLVRIFWNGGFLLLFLFVAFYLNQIILIAAYWYKNKRSKLKPFLYFGMVFIFLRFVSEFSSGITYTSYNLMSYFIIGGILSLTYIESLKSKMKRSNSKIY